MDIRNVTASNDTKLVLQRDASVKAEGKLGQTIYTIQGRTGGTALTALRLETLLDESLPKNGPGRADDGNFVLTEIEARWAPVSNPSKWTDLKLHKAQADFSQGNFPVGNAVDGNKGGNNGWAVSPQLGQYHVAVFELKESLPAGESVLIEVRMTQNYQSNKHAIGRFRLSLTDAVEHIDLGIPSAIESLLALDAGDRSDDQFKELETFYRSRDAELAKLEKTLEETRKPRPEDPELTRLKARLELVSKPLPMDPTLKGLRRAFELSSEQIKHSRLTAAQDVAWALINNPSFLFNH